VLRDSLAPLGTEGFSATGSFTPTNAFSGSPTFTPYPTHTPSPTFVPSGTARGTSEFMRSETGSATSGFTSSAALRASPFLSTAALVATARLAGRSAVLHATSRFTATSGFTATMPGTLMNVLDQTTRFSRSEIGATALAHVTVRWRFSYPGSPSDAISWSDSLHNGSALTRSELIPTGRSEPTDEFARSGDLFPTIAFSMSVSFAPSPWIPGYRPRTAKFKATLSFKPSAPGQPGAAGLATFGIGGFSFWYLIGIAAAVLVIVAIIVIWRRLARAKMPSIDESAADVPTCGTFEEDCTLFFNEISREQQHEMSIEYENPDGQHLETLMQESDAIIEDDQDELL
jgi:hypothetical protein